LRARFHKQPSGGYERKGKASLQRAKTDHEERDGIRKGKHNAQPDLYSGLSLEIIGDDLPRSVRKTPCGYHGTADKGSAKSHQDLRVK